MPTASVRRNITTHGKSLHTPIDNALSDNSDHSNANACIERLWPVSILSRRLAEYRTVNSELVELFRRYQKEHPAKSTSAGSVYSSPDNFAEGTDNPALQHLEKFIMDNVFAIASEVNAPYWKAGASLDVKLTGLWFQISNNFGFHQVHTHGNCSWSGVYYAQAGSSSRSRDDLHANGMLNGITRFYGPHTEYLAGGHGDRGNYYLHNYTHDSFPEDGKLCVFPSHLKHMVFPYQGEQDRIIVSFHAVVDADDDLRYDYSFT